MSAARSTEKGQCRRNNEDVDGGYSDHRKGPWAPAREGTAGTIDESCFFQVGSGVKGSPKQQ